MGRTTLGGNRAGGPRVAGAMGVCALALALIVVWVTLRFEAHDAFWLDESWTGAVIAQPTWADTFRQIYWDVNAPLYYVLLRVWSLVAGFSDAALRAPSLACAAAVPLAAALLAPPAGGLSRGQRLCWAAITGLWFPALCFAAEARCYALLLLVATAQTVAFARLLATPTLARASVWAGLAALAILVHYDALYLGAVQGLVYLGRHRLRAVKTWPAALAFAPAFGWLAYHWPRIKAFADPAIAWYAPLRPANLPAVLDYVAGGPFQVKMFAALALSALTLRLVVPPAPDRDEVSPTPGALSAVVLAAAASALAAVLLVGVGFLRPSFTFRYLTPEAPGLMLGVVLLARGLAGRRAAPATLAATALGVLAASVLMLAHGGRMAPRYYNFETASQVIARSRPSRLVFLWDHPADPVLHLEQLSALGGFFLKRDGLATPVTAVVLHRGQDPNAALAAAAGGDGRPAVLWLYDTWVHGTAAAAAPPDPARFAPALSCRNYGRGRVGVFTCVPAASGAAGADHQPWGPQPHGGA